MATVPRPKLNLFFTKNKRSKLFILMTFVYKIQVAWGFNYGFLNLQFKKGIYCVKLLLFTMYITFMTVWISNLNFLLEWSSVWFHMFQAKWLIYILFSVSLSSDSTLCSFLSELQAIDSKVGFDSKSFHLDCKLLLSCFLCYSFRIIISLLYWSVSGISVPLYIAGSYICALANSDMLLATYVLVFYSVNCRLRKLAEILKEAKYEFSSHLLTYKLYVDFVDKYKRAYDPLLIIGLCTAVPEIMMTIFFSIVGEINEILIMSDWTRNLQYTMAVEAFAVILAPGIVAGMLNSQTERIKLLLHDKLLEEKDNASASYEIEMCIRYVEARPCRYRVYKVIPLDAGLLGMVLSFCATYLIVIIQFTNK